jgi:glycine/D-amino acid oxidase-like deaminating enzyme
MATAATSESNVEQLDVVVVGAGMSGLLMGIRLREAGIERFRIYEKASSIGGTWRENRDPGLSCDVPSFFYSYSFEPNLDWSHRFSPEAHRALRDGHFREQCERPVGDVRPLGRGLQRARCVAGGADLVHRQPVQTRGQVLTTRAVRNRAGAEHLA